MIKRDDKGEYLGVACDTCGKLAPSAKEIMQGHGLVNMGWYCLGGKHICPDCEHPE